MVQLAASAPALLVWPICFVRWILYPSYFLFNLIASLFIPTFQDNDGAFKMFIKRLVLVPIYGVLFAMFSPILFVFLPLRCILLAMRNMCRPYQLSVRHTDYSRKQSTLQNQVLGHPNSKYKFGAASANLCLMSECLSRMNHLKDVDIRSKQIGERLAVSQLYNYDLNATQREITDNESFNHKNGLDNNICERKRTLKKATVEGNVTTQFNYLDFIMVQEAWSSYHNKALINELHKVFPYIVHDVSIQSFSVNRFCLSSGLLIASKHPILELDFIPFKNFILHGKLISSGLLCAKILLGSNSSKLRKVGYLFNSHLQSYQVNEPVIARQMDEMLAYTRDFIEVTRGDQEDVLFSLLSGDFNVDNLSPCDKESASHRLFDVYEDVARVHAGKEKPWTVGTEFRQRYMLEPQVSSPEGLRDALRDPILRQRYMNDADIKAHTVEDLAESLPKYDDQGNLHEREEGGKRRIDHIVFNKDFPVVVEGYHFVTQLTTLTDHLPVAMDFTC